MLNRHKKNNRRGQVFIISIVIAVTVALITSYVLLRYLYEPKTEKEFLGSYQSGIIDALADGDKAVLYVDQAAKIAVSQAIEEYTYSNSAPPITTTEPTTEKSIEGITPEEIDKTKSCGNYVYRLWNTETTDCYPEYTNSAEFELNSLINKHLTELKYLPVYSDGSLYSLIISNKPLYLDKILKQDIKYSYKYDPGFDYTRIYGRTTDKYNIAIFRDIETRESGDVQQYLNNKETYSGELIWPLKNNYGVGSCFGFRGSINAGKGVTASINHGGIDIGADWDTPVYAAASGVVEFISYPTWGNVVINHGNGLKTAYWHLNTITVETNARVTQGQQIGTVGGRNDNPVNTNHPEKGPYNNYDPHLHFEVRSTTVDLNTNYDGVKGVITSPYNTDRYVNPICFIEPSIASKIQFNLGATACTSICYQEGKVVDVTKLKCACGGSEVGSKNSCSKDNSDSENSAPFKFCNQYQGVVVKETPCPKSDKAEWKVNDVKLSSTDLNSDQILKITFSVINTGDDCVAIYTLPTFTADGHDYTIDTKKSTNVYKTKDRKTPADLDVMSCTFSSDASVVEKAQAEGKCVLLSPNDDKTLTYTIQSKNLFKDYKDKNLFKNYKDNIKDYDGSKLTFTVKKGTGTGASNSNILASNIQLTNSEQTAIDKTKETLEAQGLLSEISKQAQDNGIREELLLGIITLESVGENLEIKLPSDKGVGIAQIEAYRYYKQIADTCGTQYVSECKPSCTKCDWSKPESKVCVDEMANCCSFKEFHKDTTCQIKVEAKILQSKFNQYGTNDKAYETAVKSACKNIEFQKKYLTYSGWERALRAYSSLECKDDAEAAYVETVMKYAAGWSYRGSYGSIIQDEANKGILGTYSVMPSFSVKIGLDMRLFDVLRNFANKTVLKCGAEGENKKSCIQESVTDFNEGLAKEYKERKINLTTDCDDNPKIATVNKFIEEINDCMAGSDVSCQCDTSTSDERIVDMKFDGQSTVIRYASDPVLKEVYLDYKIKTVDEKPLPIKNTQIKEINLYKDKDGNLTYGILGSNPDYTGSGAGYCTPAQNRFRFCLKTKYEYTTYDPNYKDKIRTQTFTIPFALVIRNQIPPAAVKGISASNLEHANNTIILKWDNNSEVDVVKYNIYLVDDQTEFQRPTSALRDTIKFVSVSNNPKYYTEYKDIKTDSPTCKLQNTPDSDYCIFEYSATDKDGKTVSITLQPGSTYYLSDSKKFMYILSGKDTGITLTSGQEKFIAITALDIDDNEISNADAASFVLGENLVSITPEDKLEVGLARIMSYNFDDTTNTLQLLWNEVNIYIDGSPIIEKSKYDIYLQTESCTVDQLNDIPPSATPQTITPYSSIEIQIAKPPAGTQVSYCIYVIPEINAKGYMKGFAKTINVGDGVGSQSGTTTPTPQQSGVPMTPIPIYYMPLFG